MGPLRLSLFLWLPGPGEGALRLGPCLRGQNPILGFYFQSPPPKSKGGRRIGAQKSEHSYSKDPSGKDRLGWLSMCWLSRFSGPGRCSCPGLHLRLGASDYFPGLAFCFMGPWAFAWICCPQLPHRPCKNGTHSTCFYSTQGGTRRTRSCTARTDLQNKAFSAYFYLFLRSDLAVARSNL